jgi:outer membrane protein OmpA-like peptidoglycan-associated protein
MLAFNGYAQSDSEVQTESKGSLFFSIGLYNGFFSNGPISPILNSNFEIKKLFAATLSGNYESSLGPGKTAFGLEVGYSSGSRFGGKGDVDFIPFGFTAAYVYPLASSFYIGPRLKIGGLGLLGPDWNDVILMAGARLEAELRSTGFPFGLFVAGGIDIFPLAPELATLPVIEVGLRFPRGKLKKSSSSGTANNKEPGTSTGGAAAGATTGTGTAATGQGGSTTQGGQSTAGASTAPSPAGTPTTGQGATSGTGAAGASAATGTATGAASGQGASTTQGQSAGAGAPTSGTGTAGAGATQGQSAAGASTAPSAAGTPTTRQGATAGTGASGTGASGTGAAGAGATTGTATGAASGQGASATQGQSAVPSTPGAAVAAAGTGSITGGTQGQNRSIILEDGKQGTLSSIYFEPDTADLIESYRSILDTVGRQLAADPGLKLLIRAYAANFGTADGRYIVSANRARFSRDFFTVQYGISANRFTIEAYGADRSPIYATDDWQSHRCVELILFRD